MFIIITRYLLLESAGEVAASSSFFAWMLSTQVLRYIAGGSPCFQSTQDNSFRPYSFRGCAIYSAPRSRDVWVRLAMFPMFLRIGHHQESSPSSSSPSSSMCSMRRSCTLDVDVCLLLFPVLSKCAENLKQQCLLITQLLHDCCHSFKEWTHDVVVGQ